MLKPIYEFTCQGCKLVTATHTPSLEYCDDCFDNTRRCDLCDKRAPYDQIVDLACGTFCVDCDDERGYSKAERKAAARFAAQDQHYAACKEAYLGVGR